jgi:hypothetical protein
MVRDELRGGVLVLVITWDSMLEIDDTSFPTL